MDSVLESLQLYFHTFKNADDINREHKLSCFELMSISWALHMIYAFYSVFALYLGVKSYTYFSSSKDFTHLVLNSFSFKFQKIGLLTTLVTVILYPFLFQFYYKAWRGIFKFYAHIFENKSEDLEISTEEILNSAFSANLFLIFPIVGNVLSNIAHAFFIFQGLKRKYEFTSLQASLVLLTPLFFVFLFAVFSASYFVFLFSML